MSIPLDRLYHYIENVAKELHGDVVIYHFYPHGSKKIEHLVSLRPGNDWFSFNYFPEIFCNDQEPLNFHLYNDCSIEQHCIQNPALLDIWQRNSIKLPTYNFRGTIRNIWDHALLLHSEQRSDHVNLYSAAQFIPVYYWSHGVIAQDWFRFAQHVQQQKQVNKTFLVYGRGWGGTREYRLKFFEHVVQAQLHNSCLTSVSAQEPESNTHYSEHKFDNETWRPNLPIDEFFPKNESDSHYSADFFIEDYESTCIEVVLETLFDDPRWHLTEKILRPIACGQPFVLAATYRSLEYLRSYGFKTFDSVWDEHYDQIKDPAHRLVAIVELMKQFEQLSAENKKQKLAQAQAIADFNKQHFFSAEFSNLLLSELQTNLKTAFEQMKKNNTSRFWFHRRSVMKSCPEWSNHINTVRSPWQTELVEAQAKKYYTQNSQ